MAQMEQEQAQVSMTATPKSQASQTPTDAKRPLNQQLAEEELQDRDQQKVGSGYDMGTQLQYSRDRDFYQGAMSSYADARNSQDASMQDSFASQDTKDKGNYAAGGAALGAGAMLTKPGQKIGGRIVDGAKAVGHNAVQGAKSLGQDATHATQGGVKDAGDTMTKTGEATRHAGAEYTKEGRRILKDSDVTVENGTKALGHNMDHAAQATVKDGKSLGGKLAEGTKNLGKGMVKGTVHDAKLLGHAAVHPVETFKGVAKDSAKIVKGTAKAGVEAVKNPKAAVEAGKAGVKALAKHPGAVLKRGLQAAPVVGTVAGAGFVAYDLMKGKKGDAVLDAGMMVPGVGTMGAAGLTAAQAMGAGDKIDSAIDHVTGGTKAEASDKKPTQSKETPAVPQLQPTEKTTATQSQIQPMPQPMPMANYQQQGGLMAPGGQAMAGGVLMSSLLGASQGQPGAVPGMNGRGNDVTGFLNQLQGTLQQGSQGTDQEMQHDIAKQGGAGKGDASAQASGSEPQVG